MSDAAPSYQVLARKYRPVAFDDLIGQDAMVRTLRNALEGGRLAHAFILTGVRGIGKTTTARIIARALNCIGPNGSGGPTMQPCGECEHCRAIAEDRHIDVLEIDAASHTGVDHMRELIDGVRYAPVSARVKVYIVDEVHMLSQAAFNALLKTLEEPPPHVTFIFATTEIRKVPVTVLSRCQRFDLRRLPAERLAEHLGTIAGKEGASVEPLALALIARAAEGSVRDGLSLLDQAIAHGDGTVTEQQVRDMIGLADRARILDLMDSVLGGNIGPALAILRDLYDAGADPIVILQDLLDETHWLTRLKVTPGIGDDPTIAEEDRVRGRAMVEQLSMSVLARAWQMLLKGLTETQAAPQPLAATEMVLVRLCYAADLPSPADLVRLLGDAGAAPPQSAPPAASTPPAASPVDADAGGPRAATAPQAPPAAAASRLPSATPMADPESFLAVAELAREHKEMELYANLMSNVRPVRFEPGHIEIRPEPSAPGTLARDLSVCLERWTGRAWSIVVSDASGAPTLQRQGEIIEEERRASAAEDPAVQAALEAFPGAEIVDVRDVAPVNAAPADNGEEIA